MSPNRAIIPCRLVGGPFDGADCEEFIAMQTIMMNTEAESDSGRRKRFAVYRRPHPDVITHDGLTEFHYFVMPENPSE
jgi:hypothetical protein